MSHFKIIKMQNVKRDIAASGDYHTAWMRIRSRAVLHGLSSELQSAAILISAV